MSQEMNDFLNEALKIVAPVALAILGYVMLWLQAEARKRFALDTQKHVVAETVKFIAQTKPELSNPDKKALAVQMLADDKRVGDVPETTLEAAVFDAKQAAPCPPAEPAPTDPTQGG